MDAGWRPDPTGRAAWRWWDGTDWSRFSADYEPTEPPAEYRTHHAEDLRLQDSDRPHPVRHRAQGEPTPRSADPSQHDDR